MKYSPGNYLTSNVFNKIGQVVAEIIASNYEEGGPAFGEKLMQLDLRFCQTDEAKKSNNNKNGFSLD